MAVYEALLLNTAVPQIQAAQAGDSYVMVVNATTPALRITQTGTGDSILVEDAANPDSSPFVVTSAGDVGIGTSSPAQKLHVVSTSRDVAIIEGTDDGALNGPYLNLYRNSATPAANDYLGFLQFSGKNTSGTAVDYGWIGVQATQVTTSPAQKGDLVFSTANAAAPDEKMRLDASGNLGLGVLPPSAWNAGGKIIEVGSAGNILFGTTSATGLTRNASYISGWKYQAAVAATYYEQYAGTHAWYRSTSTPVIGNDPVFSQAMTLDASGRQLVGYTSSVGTAYQPNIQVKGSSTSNFGAYGVVSSNNELLGFMGVWSNGENSLVIVADPDNLRASSSIVFSTDGVANERARITSGGDLLVGTNTNLGGGKLDVSSTARVAGFTTNSSSGSQDAVNISNQSNTAYQAIRFFVNGAPDVGSVIGSISCTTTATAYNTSSDYRLKDNPQPLTNSGAFVDALQPKTWNWKADGSKGVGFIAHEAQEVSPSSVVGAKDAVDADGKPVMQAMEYGSAEFIANIVAELQSLRARVAQLEAK